MPVSMGEMIWVGNYLLPRGFVVFVVIVVAIAVIGLLSLPWEAEK